MAGWAWENQGAGDVHEGEMNGSGGQAGFMGGVGGGLQDWFCGLVGSMEGVAGIRRGSPILQNSPRLPQPPTMSLNFPQARKLLLGLVLQLGLTSPRSLMEVGQGGGAGSSVGGGVSSLHLWVNLV